MRGLAFVEVTMAAKPTTIDEYLDKLAPDHEQIDPDGIRGRAQRLRHKRRHHKIQTRRTFAGRLGPQTGKGANRRESEVTKLWSAPAKRSGDGAFGSRR